MTEDQHEVDQKDEALGSFDLYAKGGHAWNFQGHTPYVSRIEAAGYVLELEPRTNRWRHTHDGQKAPIQTLEQFTSLLNGLLDLADRGSGILTITLLPARGTSTQLYPRHAWPSFDIYQRTD